MISNSMQVKITINERKPNSINCSETTFYSYFRLFESGFSVMYKKTILSTTLGFLIMQFLFPCIQGQSQTHSYKTIMIFTGPIRLTVGHNYWTKFHIPQNVTSSYLKGYVRASGSMVNTVTLKLYEADKCPSPDLK